MKASFMSVTSFWILRKSQEENFINSSYPKHPKIIEIKNDKKFIFTLV